MISARTTRVSAAIATVLAVTLGAGALSVPATAAPLPATVADEAGTRQAPVSYPEDGFFTAAGKTGFLTSERSPSQKFRWTRFADGSSTMLDASVADSTGTDVIMTGMGQSLPRSLVVKLHDMAAGGSTVTIDLGPLNGVYVQAVSKDTVLAEFPKADGTVELRLVTRTGDTVTQRKVEGIPAGASSIAATPARDGSVLVDYYLGSGTPAVAEPVRRGGPRRRQGRLHARDRRQQLRQMGGALSATHLAWAAEGGTYVTVDRATGAESRIDIDFDFYEGDRSVVALLGSWAMYGTPATLAGNGTGDTRKLIPLTAKSLTSGETVELLDYVEDVKPGADNTLLARGGTVEQGEGLYRIFQGADGTPAAELVASTGEPTQLVYLGQQIPPTVDVTSPISLKWKLSRENADVDLTIRHRATGEVFEKTLHLYSESAGSEYYYGDGVFGIRWEQIEAVTGKEAEAGVRVVLRGPPAERRRPRRGSERKFRRRQGPSHGARPRLERHPDLLARDAQGGLAARHPVRRHAEDPRAAVRAGRGRPRLGNLRPDRDGRRHRLRRRRLRRPGQERRPVAVRRDRQRVRDEVGGTQVPGRRLEHLHPHHRRQRPEQRRPPRPGHRRHGRRPVDAPRHRRRQRTFRGAAEDRQRRLGHLQPDHRHRRHRRRPGGDLVARDKDGVLWLYLGKGDGTFAARTQIGGGWQAYTDTIGIGDANDDGHPDLYAYGPGNKSWYYAGTGAWRTPFAPRATSSVLPTNSSYNHVS
ncbi:FG-GAP repeat domain-containing protein [Streptomyces zhihengii]